MSNLTLQAQWHDAINQVETTEKILGGAAGNANLATKQLAENLLWLKQQLADKVTESIKIGDTYTTTIDHANAAAVKAHHGYGTWERFAEGRTLVGLSTKSSDPADYKTIGIEFGANTHTLTPAESASHKHGFIASHYATDVGVVGDNIYIAVNDKGGESITHPATEPDGSRMTLTGGNSMISSGGGQPHNNIQPSKVVGHWLRTA